MTRRNIAVTSPALSLIFPAGAEYSREKDEKKLKIPLDFFPPEW